MDTLKRILLVEDDDAHYELIRRGFSDKTPSWVLLRAIDIFDAKSRLVDFAPDLIISDYRLPDGEGISLLIKDENHELLYPVIIMTSYGNESLAVEAIKSGAIDYIVKSPDAFFEMPLYAKAALREWENRQKLKAAQAALKESEERYNSLFHRSLESIYIHDFQGNFLDANNTALDFVGTQREKITSFSFADFIIPGQMQSAIEIIQEIVRDGTQSTYSVYEIITLRGEHKFIESKGSLLYKNGKPCAILSVARDITMRVQAEQQVLFFKQIIELAPDPFIWVDPEENFRYKFCNQAACLLFERSLEEMTRLTIPDLDPDYTLEFCREGWRTLRLGKSLIIESRFILQSGETRYLENSFGHLDLGGKEYAVGFTRDITARKAAELVMKENEKRLRLIFENLPIGISLTDMDARIRYLNPVAEQLLGITYSQIEQAGDSFAWHMLSVEGAEILFDNLPCITAIRQNQPVLNFEAGIILEDGLTRWLSINAAPFDYSGYGSIVTYTDVTERKEYEERMIGYAEGLKELNAAKDKFFSIIAHDLKSPFQGLLGFTSILSDELESLSQEQTKQFISNIRVSARTVYDLIEKLLQWSRLQTGRINFKPEKLELSDEAAYVLNLLSGVAARKNISLVNTVDENIFTFADEDMLRLVLQNLVSNAIKFTKPEGSVTLSVFRQEDFIVFSVKDNGVGIKPQDLQKLFRIDMQHSTKGTAHESGTGLGLLLCKEMIEKHGGKIWVQSTFSEGTEFLFTLPLFVPNATFHMS